MMKNYNYSPAMELSSMRWDSSDSSKVELLTQDPKFEGSKPDAACAHGREKSLKRREV